MAIRILLMTVWLALPVAAWAWHMGAGQDQVKLDEVAKQIAAEAAAAEEDYSTAVERYEEPSRRCPRVGPRKPASSGSKRPKRKCSQSNCPRRTPT